MAASAPKSRCKPAKAQSRTRRGLGLAGVSMFATTGILGAYVGYPGLRRAHAATACTAVTNEATLRTALGEVGAGTCDTITISAGTITLTSTNLPLVNLQGSSLTITGAGTNDTIIDGTKTGANPTNYRGFHFSNGDVSISSLTIQNMYGTNHAAVIVDSANLLELTDVALKNNAGNSAAISLGSVTVTDSTFSGNQATSDSGGAIFARNTATVSGSTFSSNAARTAGAIYAYYSVAVSDSTFSSNSTTRFGGAIYSYGYGADITITDSTFTSNSATIDGGAVFQKGYNSAGITITDSTFTGNTADSDGGAVYAQRNSIDITDSTFTSNVADVKGGAVMAKDGGVTASGSTFTTNEAYRASAANWGGAIYSYSNLTVTSSTFTGNEAGKAASSSGRGGALFVSDGVMSVTDSTFQNNYALSSGGAVRTDDRNAVRTHSIASSTFTGNSATYTGGAVYTYNANLNVENSTFTGNSAREGSAIYTYYYGVTVDFSTITANSAGSAGSAAIYDYADGSTLTVSNSIVYNNVDSNNDVYDVKAGADLSLTYSLLTSATSFSAAGTATTSDLLYGDPMLGTLANNGGPTQTMLPAADSPVIGMANPTGAPSTDQRGFSRTTDGLADMGSVERGGTAPEPDLSQMPPAWFQAQQRKEQSAVCPPGMVASWAEWPNEGTGGWTCEWSTWWDVNKGTAGGWVTTPGFNPGLRVSD